jgi:hypothetical protein
MRNAPAGTTPLIRSSTSSPSASSGVPFHIILRRFYSRAMIEQDANHVATGRQASSTRAWRGTRGCATASTSEYEAQLWVCGAGFEPGGLYWLGGRVQTASRPTGGSTASGVLLRSGPNSPVCQIRSGDADDRGNLSRSTRLGLLKCIERRRRLEGLLSQVGDDELGKLARAGRSCSSRPGCLGGDSGRFRGRCLNSRAPGRERGPASAGDGLRSTTIRCNRRLRCLVYLRLSRLALNGNGATAGRSFQCGIAFSVGRTIPSPGRRNR